MSFILTYLIKNYAIKKAMVAEVNERSSHTVPTPHGGGIAIALTWFVGLLYLYYTSAIDSTLFRALMIGFGIAAVSFFDDLHELSPKIRLLAQTLVAAGGLYALGGLQGITLFGLFDITNPVASNLFAFLLIVWYINLYNFLDGINGYAGAEAVFLSVAGWLLFGGAHFIVLGVAVLGFLYWNWNRAKIFMGDVGSTLLGYTIAIFTLYYANVEANNLWVWVILFAPFWFDATLTLIRRKRNGEKLSKANKKHAYQRLTQAGWSHYKTTNALCLVNTAILFLVYLVPNIVAAFTLTILLLSAIMYYIETQKPFK